MHRNYHVEFLHIDPIDVNKPMSTVNSKINSKQWVLSTGCAFKNIICFITSVCNSSF